MSLSDDPEIARLMGRYAGIVSDALWERFFVCREWRRADMTNFLKWCETMDHDPKLVLYAMETYVERGYGVEEKKGLNYVQGILRRAIEDRRGITPDRRTSTTRSAPRQQRGRAHRTLVPAVYGVRGSWPDPERPFNVGGMGL